MSTPITIRIRQKGYARTAGYQATQWAVTVPVSDPLSDPPIATEPLSFAPLFVVRDVGGFETFERIRTLTDILPVRQLVWFDARGVGGNVALINANTGDYLTITTPPEWWLESDPPYDAWVYKVSQVRSRYQGEARVTGAHTVSLPGYSFSPEDVGRWVYLYNFANPSNAGWARILSFLGTVATVDKTFASNDIGAVDFRIIEVAPDAGLLEPHYFPTKTGNLAWKLTRDATLLATGTAGATMRDGDPAELFLTTRLTLLLRTPQQVEDLFVVCRAQVSQLQHAAARAQETFLDLITYTIGP